MSNMKKIRSLRINSTAVKSYPSVRINLLTNYCSLLRDKTFYEDKFHETSLHKQLSRFIQYRCRLFNNESIQSEPCLLAREIIIVFLFSLQSSSARSLQNGFNLFSDGCSKLFFNFRKLFVQRGRSSNKVERLGTAELHGCQKIARFRSNPLRVPRRYVTVHSRVCLFVYCYIRDKTDCRKTIFKSTKVNKKYKFQVLGSINRCIYIQTSLRILRPTSLFADVFKRFHFLDRFLD